MDIEEDGCTWQKKYFVGSFIAGSWHINLQDNILTYPLLLSLSVLSKILYFFFRGEILQNIKSKICFSTSFVT